MDIERISRYKDKLNLISERKQDIEEWVSGYDSSDFIEDKKTRLAVYKAFQELVEASFDVAAMVCKDLKIIPKDDYTNIDLLFEKKIINSSLKNSLSESNGLRNRLVHRYNELNDSLAFDSIIEHLTAFSDFSEVIEKWLRSNL
ncbi:MAG: DUF86 domain-containing protein [Euryarchaeota archaeon]|nr:DUF86 domain-containing protein [Euryarchaeota archaeon]MBU4340139.1 DUF86 domain-containing protein [Euryarchaeota archaeon]MBU4453611.1 DUF86 domain-containing protein [Euryarchaeota archaeon]MCG2737875.1 DUF86 domain-containing protein [Candidatus Methanoperedenaceae archaeon]